MAARHLHELLREEQEPFALSRFIDERRCQLLRRPHSGNPPPSGLHRHTRPHPHHHHLQIERHVSDVSENRAFSPSALLKSPSSPFIPRREVPFVDAKRSPLLHLPVEKSPPSSASRITAALLLEAAMRIQKAQEQERRPGGTKRRKRRKKKETGNPSRGFSLGFLACMLKRLVVGKRQRGITGEEEEAAPPFVDVPAKGILEWEARGGENAVGRARHQQREADLDTGGDPHCGSQTDHEHRRGGDGRSPQRPTCHRCGIPECPQSDGGAFPSVSGRASAPPTSSPPRTHPRPTSPSPPPRVPSPELRTPAASPDRRRTERQLFGGAGVDGGRPATTYYEEKKEQFSPVSVLDPPSDEEDHHHHHHRQHSPTEQLHAQAVEQQEQQAVEEDDDEEAAAAAADVDSFQHSLAVVQRAKQQLLSRLRRFERLAELDPLELERRLAAEEDDDEDDEEEEDEDGGGGGDWDVCRPEAAVGCLQEAPEVCELVRAVLGLPGGSGRKIPADTRRLVLDLAEEERRGSRRGVFDGVERTAEGVRRRFEAWKGVESDTIDMMVGTDLRQEGGDRWRMFRDETGDAAAEVEAAAFASLVEELMDELLGYVI